MCAVWTFVAVTVLLWLPDISSVTPGDGSVTQDERYLKGKEKYELLQKESAMPKYSACWTEALSSLDYGCRHLTDDAQHRLALKFSNCFLKKTGRRVYECDDKEAMDVCTGEMAPEAYGVYTEFFTHTQNICYFLQAQTWQHETEHTIDRLADNSAHVAQQIEDSSQLQSQVIQKQNETIQNQQILIDRGVELKKTLEASTVDVHSMLAEFKVSTNEQKAMIFEVFDRLTALQNIVMGEFTGFYSLIFYTVSILVSYLLTSTQRTSSARFWLFLLMTVNVVMERLVVAWGAEQYQDAESGHLIDANTEMYRRLWWCRKMFSVLSVLVWLRCAIKYQDYTKINNTLLVEIKKQNSDLKHLLQTGTPTKLSPDESMFNRALDFTDLSTLDSVVDTPRKVEQWSLTTSLRDKDKESTTGYESDSDTLSEQSYTSMMTDRTFTVSHLGGDSDSDGDSYCTGVTHESLREELQYLREATPLRELGFDADVSNSTDHSMNSERRKRGRPKGSKNQKGTPVQSPGGPCQYNLRSRLGVLKVTANPIVRNESAEDFGRVVRHMAMVSQRNRVKAEATVARGNMAAGNNSTFFSSDDD